MSEYRLAALRPVKVLNHGGSVGVTIPQTAQMLAGIEKGEKLWWMLGSRGELVLARDPGKFLKGGRPATTGSNSAPTSLTKRRSK